MWPPTGVRASLAFSFLSVVLGILLKILFFKEFSSSEFYDCCNNNNANLVSWEVNELTLLRHEEFGENDRHQYIIGP